MRRRIIPLVLLALAGFGLKAGCRQVPVTGRKQLVMIPESQEIALGKSAYAEVLAKQRRSANAGYVRLVERVGRRIAAVTGRDDYEWEFQVLASDQENAFCLPGGKVAVYEGILPVCQNEAGLAVVMSHEIAHAIARHGAERMSQGLLVEGVGIALGQMTRDAEQRKRALLLKAYGVGAQVGFVLPYSRKHEAEADRMGLVYMAKAGYDPSEAPRFWERFSRGHAGGRPPEFLSTHPSDSRRARLLRQQLPTALALYDLAPHKYGLGQTIASPPPRVSAWRAGAKPRRMSFR